MEHFKSILFHKSGPAKKYHNYQSINQPQFSFQANFSVGPIIAIYTWSLFKLFNITQVK